MVDDKHPEESAAEDADEQAENEQSLDDMLADTLADLDLEDIDDDEEDEALAAESLKSATELDEAESPPPDLDPTDSPDTISEEEAAVLREEFDKIQAALDGVNTDSRDFTLVEDMDLVKSVYYLWIHWADFHVYLDDFGYLETLPPTKIEPKYNLETKTYEHVHPIFDYGDHLSASPGEQLINSTRCTGKLHNTIEKMMKLIIERAREAGGGADEMEIRVSFSGHELGQRKGFKVCIMSQDNVVVTNFDPGEWGERQLKVMDTLAEKGYLPGLGKLSG